ncbi:amidase [Nocardia alba]|uniref:amidase n=2 Tax=Nocardia alba TaxID=225051 RepID=A0A4R1G0K1_9NOCA|nr:amidase family protein [Nocardia alba]TCK01144.1 amidase [Nocardia alba]
MNEDLTAVAWESVDDDGVTDAEVTMDSSHLPADQYPIGGPAAALAARVRAGVITPADVTADALARIASENRKINAFTMVRGERARAEARELAARPDLDALPLAGVPVAVKQNIAVAGEPTQAGSAATSAEPASVDHPVVARLRAAGAIVVGLTAMPELGLWGSTDSTGCVTRNPRDVGRSAGGSSGGAAAAVAAGLVPIAHGNDGLGSIRVPAAACGVFGIKPGRHVVPSQIGADSWAGLAENGVLATTVSDAALALSVLAGRSDLAELRKPQRLRIGLAVAPPSRLVRMDRHWTAAARTAGARAAVAGHEVQPVELPYGDAALLMLLRWPSASLADADALANPELLQRRTRRHLAIGRVIQRLGLVRPSQIDRTEARLLEFFEDFDVVITPTLAAPPPKAKQWSGRGWAANVVSSVRYAPFTGLWNLLGWPAASLPMGTHPEAHTPLAAQLIGPPGSESTLLGLAAQLELSN